MQASSDRNGGAAAARAVPGTRRGGSLGHILVVEDDPDIAGALRLHLLDAGYRVTGAGDGLDGLYLAQSRPFDLVILDLLLPGLDGLEICRRLTHRPGSPPLLILTARSSQRDRVLGLDLGADDYVTKPFAMMELLARVRALLRRARRGADPSSDTERINVGELAIDCARRTVAIGGRDVPVTTKEFDLLAWFARRPGRVFGRGELLDAVWGHDSESLEHTVNSHLNRLRSKIEDDPARPRLLVTVRGAGYKLVVPPGETP